jgi:hypothetical protein
MNRQDNIMTPKLHNTITESKDNYCQIQNSNSTSKIINDLKEDAKKEKKLGNQFKS